MTIYLTEADVSGLLDMETAVDALDEAFKARAAANCLTPRVRAFPSAAVPITSWPHRGRIRG